MHWLELLHSGRNLVIWVVREFCGRLDLKHMVARQRNCWLHSPEFSNRKGQIFKECVCPHYFVWISLKIQNSLTLTHKYALPSAASVTIAAGFLRTNMYHKTIFICGIFTSIVSAEAQDWISMKIEVPLYSKWCSLILGQSWRKANTQGHALMVVL